MSEETVKTGFENALAVRMFQGGAEKTFIDKLFSKEDTNRIRAIMRTDGLKREDLLELLNLLAGMEAKLVNLSSWDRYVLLKYFVWLREMLKVNMFLFDYQDALEKNKLIELTPRAKELLANTKRLMEHNTKFLIDLYLSIERSTLSLGGTGFLETLKQKFEINYPSASTIPQPEKKGFMGGLLR